MNEPRYIDSHCHIHDEQIPDGPDGAVAAANEMGVEILVTVGCDRETSLAAIDVASRHDNVFATVGLHPHDAKNGTASIVDLLDTPGIVGIGEAGLDYYYEHSPRDEQRQVFAEHIGLAHEHDQTLVIHSRDAWDETFEILDAEGTPERTIFHCFTGGPDDAIRGLERGIYLSFSGIVTFNSAKDTQQAALLCPSEKLLVETDSPYLAPVPHRGKKNRPAWVPHIGQFLADLRDEPVIDLAAATVAATHAAFGHRLTSSRGVPT
jgi:TatD DNase family protein